MGSGDSKDYRFIGQTSRRGSFFRTEAIWREFRDRHFEAVDPIREKFEAGEYTVDELRDRHSTERLDKVLEFRDQLWATETTPHLKKNLGQARYRLDLKHQQDEPLELLRRAKSALESINTSTRAFLDDPEVLSIIKEINKLAWEFQQSIKHATGERE